MTGNKLAIYVHLPWCIKRCPYCDFNAHEIKGTLPENEYIKSLENDIIESLKLIDLEYKVVSIFFGGGTPSLFSEKGIYEILNLLNKYFIIQENCEITLEANPGTLDCNKLSGFKNSGINRLSLGVQSFNDNLLKKLGRIHTAKNAKEAIHKAIDLDFNSINIDLMHGLPDQTKKEAMFDLEYAIKTNVQDISWYELTIEPNTYFAKHPPSRVDSDTRADWMKSGREMLNQYQHYEISAFAKKNHQCIHNSLVWGFGDYLGIGAGAHSKISTKDGIKRLIKHKHPSVFIKKETKLAEVRIVNENEIAFEYFLNRLRLLKPISWQEIKAFTKLDKTSIPIQIAIKNKWLHSDNEHCKITTLGAWFLDDIVTLFLP